MNFVLGGTLATTEATRGTLVCFIGLACLRTARDIGSETPTIEVREVSVADIPEVVVEVEAVRVVATPVMTVPVNCAFGAVVEVRAGRCSREAARPEMVLVVLAAIGHLWGNVKKVSCV